MPAHRSLRSLLLLLLFAPLASVPAAIAQTVDRAAAKETLLTIRGTALRPDGTVAKDAVLELMEDQVGDVPIWSIADGEFEIRTSGTAVNPSPLRCRTPDGRLQATILMQGHTLRKLTLSPLRLELQPAHGIRVFANDTAGKPVAGAHVLVRTDSGYSHGTSNAEGLALVRVPAGQSLFGVAAWTEDGRIGGKETHGQRENRAKSPTFTIELRPTTPVRARAVDAERKPLAGIPLHVAVFVPETSLGRLWGVPSQTQITDAQGEVVFPVPDWPNREVFVHLAEGHPWRSLDENGAKRLLDGVYETAVAPSRANERIEIQGTLEGGTADNAGLLVEFWSFDGEEESRMDVIQARTDSQGRFRAKVLPGSDYFVYVNDHELVATTWSGVLAASQDSVRQMPKLSLIPGTRVEIVVTQGPDREPLVDAWLHFDSQDQKEKEHSPKVSALRRGFWGKTDRYGRCGVIVAPGDLEIRVTAGEWSLEKRVTVVDSTPLEVPLHREVADRLTVRGRLTLPEGTEADLSGTPVTLKGMDGESEDTATVQTDREGRFTARIAAKRVSLVAAPADKPFCAVAIFDVDPEPVDVPLLPTVPFEGRIVESDGQPAAGNRLLLMGRRNDHERPNRPKRRYDPTPFVELFRSREATTDAEGRFTFPNVPQRVELTLTRLRPDDEKQRAYLGEFFLEPGETRPPLAIRLVPKGPPVRGPRSAGPVVQSVVRDARLAGLRVLVAVTGDGEAPGAFLTQLLDGDRVPDIYQFLSREIRGAEDSRLPETQGFLAERNWAVPGEGHILLAVLDGEGKELGRLTLDAREAEAALAKGIEFMREQRPPQEDARDGFDAALAEAKRSGRRVWARACGSRCGPCFLLSRWIDDHRELLERDFVLFHFDAALDRRGPELSDSLQFSRHGIPCHAILEADGTPLVNSIGPLGNIGFPGDDHEGTVHLRKMLTRGARTLTTAEIDGLIRSLSAP